jgi:hypothetical protein
MTGGLIRLLPVIATGIVVGLVVYWLARRARGSGAPPLPVLDGYDIRGVLGTGATGVVYLAQQVGTDRPVAVKQLARQLASDPVFRSRFRDEARLLARLDHPNIVRAYDFVERDSEAFLVTEYVAGASLREVLRRAGPLTTPQAFGVLRGALLGLSEAHRVGLVHRDLKPENVLVDRDGTSKLADFGLAAPSGSAGDAGSGSPAYMSPEAIRGAQIDARSDIYAAGALLHELLTGRVPYPATSTLAQQRRHLDDPVPDPRTLRPALTAASAEVVMRAMAKDPADRYATAEGFLTALDIAARSEDGDDWLAAASIAALVLATTLAAGTAPGAPRVPEEIGGPGRAARLATRSPAGTGTAAGITAVVVASLISIAVVPGDSGTEAEARVPLADAPAAPLLTRVAYIEGGADGDAAGLPEGPLHAVERGVDRVVPLPPGAVATGIHAWSPDGRYLPVRFALGPTYGERRSGIFDAETRDVTPVPYAYDWTWRGPAAIGLAESEDPDAENIYRRSLIEVDPRDGRVSELAELQDSEYADLTLLGTMAARVYLAWQEPTPTTGSPDELAFHLFSIDRNGVRREEGELEARSQWLDSVVVDHVHRRFVYINQVAYAKSSCPHRFELGVLEVSDDAVTGGPVALPTAPAGFFPSVLGVRVERGSIIATVGQYRCDLNRSIGLVPDRIREYELDGDRWSDHGTDTGMTLGRPAGLLAALRYQRPDGRTALQTSWKGRRFASATDVYAVSPAGLEAAFVYPFTVANGQGGWFSVPGIGLDSTPIDVRTVDWLDRSYRASIPFQPAALLGIAPSEVSFDLRDGSGPSMIAGYQGEARLEEPLFGDLDGDGFDEAVLRVRVQVGERLLAVFTWVYTSTDLEPLEVGQHVEIWDGASSYEPQAVIRDGVLSTTEEIDPNELFARTRRLCSIAEGGGYRVLVWELPPWALRATSTVAETHFKTDCA